MNFKQSMAQNQRILSITDHHIIVGIDIAKNIHVARAVNYRGIEIGQHFSFSNDDSGFNKLRSWINRLQTQSGLNNVMVGMEPTGHYWLNLAGWLVDQGIETVIVNPLAVKRNKENRDNSQTKNDIKDALVIADMIKNGYYSPVRLATGIYKSLRVLMASRAFTLKLQGSINNQIVRWIDIYFPEYRNVFADVTCPTSLSVLKVLPTPQEINKLSPEAVSLCLNKHKTVRQISKKSIQLLIEQARHSIGDCEALQEAKLTLQQLLEQYGQVSAQLKEVEQKALKLLEEIPYAQPLLKIRGVGPITVAGILAEAGDISRYHHGNQLLRHAGLHLCEESSGKHKGQTVISKRGRPGLRRFLFLAALSLISNNNEFKQLHQQNIQTKKMKKIHSVLKLCGKLARILVAIAQNGESYDPGKVQPLAA